MKTLSSPNANTYRVVNILLNVNDLAEIFPSRFLDKSLKTFTYLFVFIK